MKRIVALALTAVISLGVVGCKVHHHGGCWKSGTCYVKPVVENP